ncbi:MAG: cyclic GMP-AMP synthase DncV-like nucleotidyltransferase [Patescibacteria group bacterium]
MTINEYFENLFDRVNIKIEDSEREFIEKKQNGLREALRVKLDLKDDFLTGSYRRHTIIKPKKEGEKFDVDVFVAFDKEKYDEKELAELHKLVTSALNNIKSEKPELGITNVNNTQRRSVCVEFGSNFSVDVVPSIQIEKDKLYKIFDQRTLRPVKSNPKLHAQLLTEANDRTNGKLVPIIKILKSWKREKCDYMKSFHLELLTAELVGGREISSYVEGIAKFFSEADTKLQQACLTDPANNEHCIDAYLDEDRTRNKILTLVTNEKEISDEAISLENNGDDDAAVREWKKIFESDDSEKVDGVRPLSIGPIFINRTPSRPHCDVRPNS